MERLIRPENTTTRVRQEQRTERLLRPETIKIRIRKNQRKAMSVGIFYWIGILLLLCCSIFPYVGGLEGFTKDSSELWILTFLDPITALTEAKVVTSEVLMPAVVAIAYIASVAVSFICACVASTRLFRITKRNPTNKWGYNRATRAMRIMCKCFALIFFMTFAVTAIGVSVLDGKPTLFFYIAFAVALIFHFVGNVRASKISLFETVEDRFNPIEIRPNVVWGLSVVRNLLQFVFVLALVLLADKLGNTAPFYAIIDGGDLALIPAVLLGVLVFSLVAVAHATSTVEYKSLRKNAKGAKTCRICAIAIAILGVAGVVLTLITPELEQAGMTTFAIIAAIGVVWFLLECWFASIAAQRVKEAEGEFIVKEPVDKDELKAYKASKKAEKKAKKQAKKDAKKAKKQAKKDAKRAKKYGILVADKFSEPEEVTEENDFVNEEAEETYFNEDYVRQEPTHFVAGFLENPNFEEYEKNGGLQEELDYDENAALLREKWLNPANAVVEEIPAPDTRLLTAQQVRCPACNTVLYVRFGWTKARCSNCNQRFEMRRCSSTYNCLKED